MSEYEGLTVHIVEDDAAVRDSMVLLLEQHDLPVQAYEDGETFLAQAAPVAGDLVLVDLSLPGVSGVEVIRHLQQLPAPPRYVAISGQSRNAIADQLRAIAGTKVVRKPLTEDKISALL